MLMNVQFIKKFSINSFLYINFTSLFSIIGCPRALTTVGCAISRSLFVCFMPGIVCI